MKADHRARVAAGLAFLLAGMFEPALADRAQELETRLSDLTTRQAETKSELDGCRKRLEELKQGAENYKEARAKLAELRKQEQHARQVLEPVQALQARLKDEEKKLAALQECERELVSEAAALPGNNEEKAEAEKARAEASEAVVDQRMRIHSLENEVGELSNTPAVLVCEDILREIKYYEWILSQLVLAGNADGVDGAHYQTTLRGCEALEAQLAELAAQIETVKTEMSAQAAGPPALTEADLTPGDREILDELGPSDLFGDSDVPPEVESTPARPPPAQATPDYSAISHVAAQGQFERAGQLSAGLQPIPEADAQQQRWLEQSQQSVEAVQEMIRLQQEQTEDSWRSWPPPAVPQPTRPPPPAQPTVKTEKRDKDDDKHHDKNRDRDRDKDREHHHGGGGSTTGGW